MANGSVFGQSTTTAREEVKMAQSHQPERDGEAEFVRRIVTDPRNVPDVMRLYGYLGASSEENHDRLYLNADLSQYVEVPRNTILHRMAVPTEQDPNGAVVLWVRRDATLIAGIGELLCRRDRRRRGWASTRDSRGAVHVPSVPMPRHGAGAVYMGVPDASGISMLTAPRPLANYKLFCCVPSDPTVGR
jgi:hypothetical protein